MKYEEMMYEVMDITGTIHQVLQLEIDILNRHRIRTTSEMRFIEAMNGTQINIEYIVSYKLIS